MTELSKHNVKRLAVVAIFALLPLFFLFNSCEKSQAGNSTTYVSSTNTVEAGKYLVTIAGCNDCHTVGYIQANGNVAESEWLTGSPVGFRGPWGTTYPANLRLSVDKYNEADWVNMCRTRETMPPMPWPSLHKMSDQDLKAIYQFIRSLGPKGTMAPLMVAPGTEPQTPYIVFEPLHMERLQQVH